MSWYRLTAKVGDGRDGIATEPKVTLFYSKTNNGAVVKANGQLVPFTLGDGIVAEKKLERVRVYHKKVRTVSTVRPLEEIPI